MKKQKTAIALAIKEIKRVQSLLSNDSQKLGLAQAMDVLEGLKEVEKARMKRIYNQGNTWASEIGSEDFFNQNYEQNGM